MAPWSTKQFVLMGGDKYYPAGGFLDFQGCFDTMVEAEEAMKAFLSDDAYKWAHIADLATGDYKGTRGHIPFGELLRSL